MNTDKTVPPCSSKAEDVDLTQVVIGAAMKVLNTLRPGLDEKLYERALVIELRNQGISCDQQKRHEVFYDGQLIGELVPDLIVDGRLIVDPKVVTDFSDSHVAQMLGYTLGEEAQVARIIAEWADALLPLDSGKPWFKP